MSSIAELWSLGSWVSNSFTPNAGNKGYKNNIITIDKKIKKSDF
jgi:hypothetical protein